MTIDPHGLLTRALPRLCLALALALPLALPAAPALAQDEPAPESPAEEVMQIPEDEAVARGSDTPRNAAFTFIVLSRDGDWADAADMLECPAAGWPEGVDGRRIARGLKSILDHRLWLEFESLPGPRRTRPARPAG